MFSEVRPGCFRRGWSEGEQKARRSSALPRKLPCGRSVHYMGYGRARNTRLVRGRTAGVGWRKPVGVEPTRGTKYRTTGLKPAPSTGQNWLPR